MSLLRHSRPAGRRALSSFVLLTFLSFPALVAARDSAWQRREDNAAWRSECGACHVAFPPALLSADDWAVIMSELERHFGTDASVDDKTRKEISAFLERNAAANRFFASRDETPRITSSDWFIRKHQGAIRLWRKGRVKSLADCGACHKGPEIDGMTVGEK